MSDFLIDLRQASLFTRLTACLGLLFYGYFWITDPKQILKDSEEENE